MNPRGKSVEWVRDSDLWSIFKEEMDENVNPQGKSVEWVRSGQSRIPRSPPGMRDRLRPGGKLAFLKLFLKMGGKVNIYPAKYFR